MAGHVHIAPEVQEALGSHVVEMLRSRGHEAICRVCGVEMSADLGDEVALVLEKHLDGNTLGWGHHERCLRSQVVYTGGPMPVRQDTDVRSVSLFLPGADLDRAVLVVGPRGQPEVIVPSGDAVPVWDSNLSREGWELLPRLGKAAPWLQEWTVHLDPSNGRGSVLGPDGDLFLDEFSTDDSPDWCSTAVQDREVTIVSSASLDGLVADEMDGRFLVRLDRLARDGRLLAGRARVEISVDPVRDAGRSLTGSLTKALTMRADDPSAGGPGHRLIPLPGRPHLLPAMDRDQPLLLLELGDDDAERASATSRSLEEAGFPRQLAQPEDRFFARAPRGWSCLVWRSQARVMVRRGDQEPHDLIFDRFDDAQTTWYDAVGRVEAIWLVVGNRISDVSDLDEVVRRMKSGDALGMAISVMRAGRDG